MSDSDDDGPPPVRQNTGLFGRLPESPRRLDGSTSGMLSPTFLGDRGTSFRLLASNSFSLQRVASTGQLDGSGSFPALSSGSSPVEIVRAACSSLRHYISEKGAVSVTDTAIPVNIRQGPKIGFGGYAAVYSGINTITGELVAIKELQVGASSPQQFDDVAAEFSLLRKLRHPNVIRYILFEHSISQQVCRIVMELMAGGSALTLLQQFGHISESVLRGYVTQMLAGLDFIHRHGITHRDIKPANILIHSSGAVKLADFGCSRMINSKTALTKDLLGTPIYMAPEVIRGGLHQKSDIWSIGCTVLELATGRRPWIETGIAEYLPLMFHITSVNRGPEIPPTVPRGLRDFLEQCFITDPDERPSAASLLIHHWLTDAEDQEDEAQEIMSRIGAQQTANLVDTLTTEGAATTYGGADNDAPQPLLIKCDKGGESGPALHFSPTAGGPSMALAANDETAMMLSEGSFRGPMHVTFPVAAPGGKVIEVELDVQPSDLAVKIVDRRPSFVLSLSENVKSQISSAMDQLSHKTSAVLSRPAARAHSSDAVTAIPTIVLDDSGVISSGSSSPRHSPASEGIYGRGP